MLCFGALFFCCAVVVLWCHGVVSLYGVAALLCCGFGASLICCAVPLFVC